MAELLPTNFQVPSESVISSYDFTSLMDGAGYVTFYLCQYKDSTGTHYAMTNQLLYSTLIGKDYYNSSGSDTLTFYSPAFATTRIIKGTINFNFCAKGYLGSGGQTYIFEIKVYHYDGTTSTQIGSTWTSQTVDLGSPAEVTNFNGFVDVSNQKKFNIGDKIKMEVKITYTTTSGGNVVFGLDPQNRDIAVQAIDFYPSTDPNAFTQFKVNIPFKVDI